MARWNPNPAELPAWMRAVAVEHVTRAEYEAVCAERDAADTRLAELEREVARLRAPLAAILTLVALTLWPSAPAPLGFARPLGGTTYTVTSTADGAGTGPTGSLRKALSQATSGTDTITFDPALNGQTITLTAGDLEV